jgi:hypothetical protein
MITLSLADKFTLSECDDPEYAENLLTKLITFCFPNSFSFHSIHLCLMLPFLLTLLPLSHADISGTEVELSCSLATPGIILDNYHFSHVCSSDLYVVALSFLTRLRRGPVLRRRIVQSHHDNANSSLFGTIETVIRKLQHIHNTLAIALLLITHSLHPHLCFSITLFGCQLSSQ